MTRAAAAALVTFVDEDRQRHYTTLVLDAIGAERRAEQERDMKHFPEPTDLEIRILARGEARGRAEGIRHERALEREG